VVELIVIETAPLAEGEEVLVAVVAGDVVEVGDGEDDADLARAAEERIAAKFAMAIVPLA
jgi:hypothetical protein